jgi:hypothetical protein
VHIAFEEGTQAQWLHDLLQPHAERVVVCNVRGRTETSNKSDRIDADELSEMLRVGSIKSVYHGASSVLTLKELVRCYTNLVDDSTRVMLRIKALFRARAIPTPGTSVYRARERAKWLARIDSRGARMRAESLLRQLDTLLELRPKAKAAMIAEASRQPGWRCSDRCPSSVRSASLVAGDHGHSVLVPDQAAALAVHRASGRHALECRSGVRQREATAPATSLTHPRSEPQSQPDAQECLQRGGECDRGQAWSIERRL